MWELRHGDKLTKIKLESFIKQHFIEINHKVHNWWGITEECACWKL